MVRSVQEPGSDPRIGYCRDQRQGRVGQGRRRRQSGNVAGISGAVDSGRIRIERWQGSRRIHRCSGRTSGARVHRTPVAVRSRSPDRAAPRSWRRAVAAPGP
ncbi:UNVERIFIED_CONTAM: hypothetical protein GTU68_010374 [Idotea baltica]|nr:hypothetical protein [Idotea baltica]